MSLDTDANLSSPDVEVQQRELQTPHIRSLEDLEAHGGTFTVKDSGERIWDYNFACYRDANDTAYFGKTSIALDDFTPEIVRSFLQPIPDSEVYPKVTPNILIAPTPGGEALHLKRPRLVGYGDAPGTSNIAIEFRAEVEAYEFLRQHPHPHIARYHGCLVSRNLIFAIALEKYPMTLEERVKDPRSDALDKLDRASLFSKIKLAIAHLHSLGWAHNDFNPRNIMLDKDENPVLIDMGSCRPFGKRLHEAGTRGWDEGHGFWSRAKHDEDALQLLWTWMEKAAAEEIKHLPAETKCPGGSVAEIPVDSQE